MKSKDQAQLAIEEIEGNVGAITNFIHGEGVRAYPPKDFLEYQLDEWMFSKEKELDSLLNCLHFVLPKMRGRKYGRFVSISYHSQYWSNHLPLHGGHIYGQNSWPFIYCKESRKILISQLACSEYKHNITLNTISPGRIQNLKIDQLTSCIKGNVPSGVTSWNVANIVNQLCSINFSHVTGADIPIINTPITYALPKN